MTIGNFASPKTIDDMIVDHPRGLHVRVADRRADELEAAVLQVLLSASDSVLVAG